jgi:hypothetical protein
MRLAWKKFDEGMLGEALAQSFCLYVFHHPKDGNRPFYIGKAKYLGCNQPSGYKRSARYNSGYQHLIAGLLHSGYSLFIAPLSESAFVDAETYEQELIALWNPIREQRVKVGVRKSVETVKPWMGK